MMWLWHEKQCPLDVLEMAGVAARQVQVIAGYAQFVQHMTQGQEDNAFRRALSRAVELGGGFLGPRSLTQSPDVAMSDADS